MNNYFTKMPQITVSISATGGVTISVTESTAPLTVLALNGIIQVQRA